MIKQKRFRKFMAMIIALAMITIVTPFSASAAETALADVFDSVQISYLNNDYSGRYLHNSSSSITATSGTMSVLGNTIKWQITPLGDGTYTIQSSSNTSLYLAGSSSASTSTIYLTSLSDSSVPNEYRWDISYATGGGCLIQNVNTGKYLYASAGTVSSSSTLGTAGTSTYR